ncbi:DUF262 domain-containing protein [Erysipelothrix rhusiopathiae]|nr:DUF262 domain-containing protein [Erysipelothrix rhusiopathiae]MDE8037307.1 DUF262 domain-containing protein [Erysipelothrix rhusiopathiae]MDE8038676.1 DUF262 domain-containing protein [Erysipelothrix rhusiopathiae]MDE8044403.1 DUF262 domain-containing protein [Erysipelothrix rhusiopathiae]MDE8050635.1 DUF262 domain-containing protein [Erysipelothrix rhusiopathiae]
MAKIVFFIEFDKDKFADITDLDYSNQNLRDVTKYEVATEDEFNTVIDGLKIINEESLEKIEEFKKNLFENDRGDIISSFKIKHWVSNRSFGELIDMYEHDEIIIPEMQRSFVWDSYKCSRLIESIILGLPIPPLFLLEVDDNKYELIDGYQRITAISNYVNGKQWNYSPKLKKRTIASRLSKGVDPSIAGKTFEQLTSDFQTKIKRSTVPLIEFKQLDPSNFNSKFYIFERINTGSVKLNPMQIRKSLASSDFMLLLYDKVRASGEVSKLFSSSSVKNDADIEAILRVLCFFELFYQKSFTPNESGLKNILNEYSNSKINKQVSEYEELLDNIFVIIGEYNQFFGKNEIFRRVENSDNPEYKGVLNVSIMESFICASLSLKLSGQSIDYTKLKEKYEECMLQVSQDAKKSGKNPFSISTGASDSIYDRLLIAKNLVFSDDLRV